MQFLLVSHILPLKVHNSHSYIGNLAKNTAQRYGVSFGNYRINFVVFFLGYDPTIQHLPDDAHRGLVGNEVLTILIHLSLPPCFVPGHSTPESNRSGSCCRSSQIPLRTGDKYACSKPSVAPDPGGCSTTQFGTERSRISSACNLAFVPAACHTPYKPPA